MKVLAVAYSIFLIFVSLWLPIWLAVPLLMFFWLPMELTEEKYSD